jgi:hypothetical protein
MELPPLRLPAKPTMHRWEANQPHMSARYFPTAAIDQSLRRPPIRTSRRPNSPRRENGAAAGDERTAAPARARGPSFAVYRNAVTNESAAAANVQRSVSPWLLRASSSREAAKQLEEERRSHALQFRAPERYEFTSNDVAHTECLQNCKVLMARAEHLAKSSILHFETMHVRAGLRAQNKNAPHLPPIGGRPQLSRND